MENLKLEDLRNQIREDLEDFPSADTLGAAVNATDQQITVTLGKEIGVSCFLQIDTEVLQVIGLDENANTVGVVRGMRNTTATSHLINAAISVNPLFPDAEINKTIRSGLGALYPRLFRTASKTGVTAGTRTVVFTLDDATEILPADPTAPKGISQVWLWTNKTNESEYIWTPMKNWVQHTNSNGDIIIQFKEAIQSGLTVKIVWMAPWEILIEDDDETTIDATYFDILSYYVCGRLGEKRLRKRLRFEGHSVDTDPSKSSAADILGGAGFDMFRFEKVLEERKMAPLAYYLGNQNLY